MSNTQMLTTKGLVICERSVGEADKFIEILTEDFGVIEVSVKGVKKITSKNSGSSQLFAYSKFCLNKRGDRYYINSSEVISVFYDLRYEVEKISLASYFAELVKYTLPVGLPCKNVLRLYLNTLHCMCSDNKELSLLKSIFELRLLSEIGMLPQLIGCSNCFCYESQYMYFNIEKANLICDKCVSDEVSELNIKIHIAVLRAVRHICLSEFDKVFNFSLTYEYIYHLSDFSERYTLYQLGRNFRTLSFYKKIIGGTNEQVL